jgi:hypothetical protein
VLRLDHVHPVGQLQREEPGHADRHHGDHHADADRERGRLEELVRTGETLHERDHRAEREPERDHAERHHEAEREALRAASLRGLRETHDLERDHGKDARREVEECAAERRDREQEQESGAVRVDRELVREDRELEAFRRLLARADASVDGRVERRIEGDEGGIRLASGGARDDLEAGDEVDVGGAAAADRVARLERHAQRDLDDARLRVGADRERDEDDGRSLVDGVPLPALADVGVVPVLFGPLDERGVEVDALDRRARRRAVGAFLRIEDDLGPDRAVPHDHAFGGGRRARPDVVARLQLHLDRDRNVSSGRDLVLREDEARLHLIAGVVEEGLLVGRPSKGAAAKSGKSGDLRRRLGGSRGRARPERRHQRHQDRKKQGERRTDGAVRIDSGGKAAGRKDARRFGGSLRSHGRSWYGPRMVPLPPDPALPGFKRSSPHRRYRRERP